MKTQVTHDKPGEFRAILDTDFRDIRNDTSRVGFDISAGISDTRGPADVYISIQAVKQMSNGQSRTSYLGATIDLDEMRTLHDNLSRALAAADVHGSPVGED